MFFFWGVGGEREKRGGWGGQVVLGDVVGWWGAIFGNVGAVGDAFRMLQERGNDFRCAMEYDTEVYMRFIGARL